MSHRHAAEKLFNDMLHDFRVDILPTVAENWSQITEPERKQLTWIPWITVCGLHLLVGLADAVEEAVKLWEARFNSFGGSTSSGTQRLVRAACKAFHHRGFQQCGSATLFHTYLRKEGIHSTLNLLATDSTYCFLMQQVSTICRITWERLLKRFIGDKQIVFF